MDLNTFVNISYYLYRVDSTNLTTEQLCVFQKQYEAYLNSHSAKQFRLGLPITMRNTPFDRHMKDWASTISELDIFYYFNLIPHATVSQIIAPFHDLPLNEIHILPSEDLNYGRFKEELWDFHLAGKQIYFHHVNEVKTFTRNTQYFQKLADKGVCVGICVNWNPSWLGTDRSKIKKLIGDLSVHHFDTCSIDIHAESYISEQQLQIELLTDL